MPRIQVAGGGGGSQTVGWYEDGDTPADLPGVLYLKLSALTDGDPGGGTAAPTLVGGAQTITATGFVTARPVAMPASGVVAGDVLAVLVHGNLDPQFDITPPAGWTARTATGHGDVQLFTKTADGTENGTTATFTFLNGSERAGAYCYHLRGVAEVPVAMAKADGFSDSMATPALAGVDSDAVVIGLLGSSSDYVDTNTITPPAGWTSDAFLTHARMERFAHTTGAAATGAWSATNGKLRMIVAAFA